MNLDFSIIIAVYQREDELKELLQSLTQQTDKDFEIIVVDDGSPAPLEPIVNLFYEKLNIHYYFKENSGPGKSRNYGMEKANGNYFIFLDSDTVIPAPYISIVRNELQKKYVDAYGGPDDADESFSDLQKAISFSMTSFLTTGGIRGGKKHIGKFQPRSFNMGISKNAFEKTGGFGNLRIGEDPDLSMTLWEKGFETRLFPEAKVFHKRRASLAKFAKQVYQFGIARPILNQRHPNHTKLTFWFPSLFLLLMVYSMLAVLIPVWPMVIYYKIIYGKQFFWLNFNNPIVLTWFFIERISILSLITYFFFIFLLSILQFKNLKVGFLSIITTIIQFFCYGYGFLKSWIFINLLNQNPKKKFPHHFYK